MHYAHKKVRKNSLKIDFFNHKSSILNLFYYLCTHNSQLSTTMFRKLLSFLLTLMGFSAAFVFESCYGPMPANYNPDEVDSLYETRCDTIDPDLVPTDFDEQTEAIEVTEE